MMNLDEFFAKRDKRKSRAKSNYLTPDELLRNMEETVKTELSPRGSKPESHFAVGPSSTSPHQGEISGSKTGIGDTTNDEEWHDFMEEQRKDYTGLKISQLIIPEFDEEYVDEDNSNASNDLMEPISLLPMGGDGNGDGESNTSGPWKINVGSNESTNSNINGEIESTKLVKPKQKTEKKVYVPPALRHSQGDMLDTKIRKTTSRGAPDLRSDVYFPSLDSAVLKPQKIPKKLKL